jgi:hypothetical protein
MFYSFYQLVVLKVKNEGYTWHKYLFFTLFMYDIINSVYGELGERGPYDYPDRIGSNYCKFLSSSWV